MDKPFYSHLVPVNESLLLLDEFSLSEQEKDDLISLIWSMYHHRIIDKLLLVLPLEHHEELVVRLANNPNDSTIIDYLKLHVPNVEERISLAGQELHQEIAGLIVLSRNDKKI